MLAGSNPTRHLPNTMFRAGFTPALQARGGGAPTAGGAVQPTQPQVNLAASVPDVGKREGYRGIMGLGGNQFGSVQPPSIPPPPPPRMPQIIPPPSVPGVIPPPRGVGMPVLPQQGFNVVQGGYGGFTVNPPRPPPPPQQAQFPPVMPGGGSAAMWGKMPPPPPMAVPPPPPPPPPLPPIPQQ